MNNRSIVLSGLAAFAAYASVAATAAVPPIDRSGKPASDSCPSQLNVPAILHFDKIVFQIATGNLTAVIAADSVALNAIPRNTELDIKVVDDPRTVAELKAKVLSFLGASNSAANRQLLRIISVEYAAVVCPKS